MRFHEARQILTDWSMWIENKDTSTNKRPYPRPIPGGGSRSYWFENAGTRPNWRNPRTVAYLAAYVEIAGAAFPGAGIEVDEGYIYPDRAVIRSLLRANCLTLSGGMLRLTDKGEALIAPMLIVENGRVRRAALLRRSN